MAQVPAKREPKPYTERQGLIKVESTSHQNGIHIALVSINSPFLITLSTEEVRRRRKEGTLLEAVLGQIVVQLERSMKGDLNG